MQRVRSKPDRKRSETKKRCREREGDGSTVRMKVADIIYVLNIQNKNSHVDKVLVKYGLGHACVGRIKAALEKGQWEVQNGTNWGRLNGS
jgi:hypothetical protein